jgi:hypothetical protein
MDCTRYLPLPSPANASRAFLHEIGLQPEPFRRWLVQQNEAADNLMWGCVRDFVKDRDKLFDYPASFRAEENDEDGAPELAAYGLTYDACRAIADHVERCRDPMFPAKGDAQSERPLREPRYGHFMPYQYVTWHVEGRIEEVPGGLFKKFFPGHEADDTYDGNWEEARRRLAAARPQWFSAWWEACPDVGVVHRVTRYVRSGDNDALLTLHDADAAREYRDILRCGLE